MFCYSIQNKLIALCELNDNLLFGYNYYLRVDNMLEYLVTLTNFGWNSCVSSKGFRFITHLTS